MRVLIINTNREHTPHVLIPFGACCASSAAKTAGHEVRFLDLTFSRSPEKAVERGVKTWQPDLVGFSIRNIDNCDLNNPIFYLPEIKRLVQVCRTHIKAPIVIGGPAVSILPDPILEYVGADYAVTGEGEAAFPALLSELAIGKSGCDVPGVAGPANGDLDPSPMMRSEECGFSYPDLGDWLDIKRYLSYSTPAPIQTKRGCLFHCSYCLYPVIEGNDLRSRSPDMVVSDIEYAKGLGFRSVDFVDSVFNVPEEHAISCCEAIAEAGVKMPLQTIGFNPAQCSPELIGSMNRAGFTATGCTAESASDQMLISLNKGFNSDRLRQTAHMLKKLDAVRLWLFMLGGPGETEQTVKETADFMRESLSSRDMVYVGCGIRILPGTDIHVRSVAEGMIREEDDLIEPRFYFSPHLTPEKAMSIITDSGFPKANIISVAESNQRLLSLIQRLAHKMGVTPPYWRFAPLWNKFCHPRLSTRNGK